MKEIPKNAVHRMIACNGAGHGILADRNGDLYCGACGRKAEELFEVKSNG